MIESPRPFDRNERVVLAAASVLVGALHAIGFAGVRLDDAFITFRYGENIARGRGFVFNPGERILGTTSPGHALIAALVHVVAGHAALPSIMSGLGALAWTAQAWLVFVLLRSAFGPLSAAIAALGIAVGAAGSYLFVPLETNLVAALVLGSIALGLRARWMAAAIVLGVAVVVRADAILAGLPLLVIAWRSLRRGIVKPILAFVAIPGAWALFAIAYFGSIWPHTLLAKAHATSLVTYARHIAQFPFTTLAATFRSAIPGSLHQASVASHSPFFIVGDVAVLAIATCGWISASRRDRRLAAIPAWALAHAAAYAILRPNVAFEWHLYPVALVTTIGVLLSIAMIVRKLPLRIAVAAVVVLPAIASWGALRFSVGYRDLFWFGARDAADQEVAAFLKANAHPGDIVDAEEVGTLAYDSDLRMIDHPGLVTRFELAATPRPNLVDDHCHALAALPHLRFVVMNRFEVDAHRCLYGDAQLAHFSRDAIDGKWNFWVADRGP